MKLVITEKIDVARAVAETFSSHYKKEDGYFVSGDYHIAWAYGHMLELKDPSEIDSKYEEWKLEDLPVYFANWGKKPVAKNKKQFDVIKRLISKADSIIHAGDTDDEGQLIVDEILDYVDYAGGVKRVLINDNTPEKIRKEFGRMQDNNKFRSITESALARQISDAIFGMTLSRFYSLKTNMNYAVGRVQTATTGLNVVRDELIEGFTKRYFYDLYLSGEVDNKFISLKYIPKKNDENVEEGKIFDFEYAELLQNKYKYIKPIVTISSKKTKTAPPLPFNLSKLQATANKLWGYSPSETLDVTQNLREKYKAITYNRSNCQYLALEHFDEADIVLKTISENTGIFSLDDVNKSIKSKCFDDTKVTAHHAIIPQNVRLDLGLFSSKEKNIYLLIVKNYVVQFMEAAIYDEKTAIVNNDDGSMFKATTKKICYKGYMALLKPDKDENETEPERFFAIDDGDYDVDKPAVEIKKKETSPPKRYTEGTLLEDMTRIAKYVKDVELREALKTKDKDSESESGSIGTEATRATIIKKIVDPSRGLIEKDKDKLITTKKAREFYNMLPQSIKTAEVTAKWWLMQEEIKEGIIDKNVLIDSVLAVVTDIIENEDVSIIKENYSNQRESIGKCPVCGENVYENKKAFSCENSFKNGCMFVLWKNNMFFTNKGKTITKTAAKSLVNGGKVYVKNLKSKKGSTYNATIIMKPINKGDKYINFDIKFDN